MKVHILEKSTDGLMWDEFLVAQPTGHHLQSTSWGQLKARFGWQVLRLLAQEGDQIVGGAQILIRSLPVWGKIGYISKGPVVIPGRNDIMRALFDRIEDVAQEHRLLLLSIQPPADEPSYIYPLETRGFNPSAFYVVPPATVLVDLRQSEDEILHQMKKKTRYCIRLASRKGVTVREGDESGLPIFYNLMQTTAARSDYVHYDLTYYQEAWRQFAPRDMMRLWIAYYQDEPLAAVIAIAYGQWGVYKWGASSEAHRDTMPNHLLQWAAIRWCKAKGCHYYDLGGITPSSVAEALKRGEKLDPTESKGAGIAHFKRGFGEIVSFPDAYDNSYGVPPKWLVRKVTSYAGKLETLRALLMGGTSIWKQKVTALKSPPVVQSPLKASAERRE